MSTAAWNSKLLPITTSLWQEELLYISLDLEDGKCIQTSTLRLNLTGYQDLV